MEWDDGGKCPIVKITVIKPKMANFTLRTMGTHWKIKMYISVYHFSSNMVAAFGKKQDKEQEDE